MHVKPANETRLTDVRVIREAEPGAKPISESLAFAYNCVFMDENLHPVIRRFIHPSYHPPTYCPPPTEPPLFTTPVTVIRHAHVSNSLANRSFHSALSEHQFRPRSQNNFRISKWKTKCSHLNSMEASLQFIFRGACMHRHALIH